MTTIGQAAELTVIEAVDQWADVFSGAEVKIKYNVRSAQPFEGRLNWSLSVNRRTVKHGQLPLTVKAGQASEAVVRVNMPEVKEGVILESQLNVAAFTGADPKPVAEGVRKVWIFPADPFTDRREWLKGLRITLFDPEGKTADVFEKSHVPFRLNKNIAALDELSEGMVVIGEAVSWQDYKSLAAAMVKLAARGVPVLCLAPGDGTMPLPGGEGADLPTPESLALRHEDVITELDKRLDAKTWPLEAKITSSRLVIKSHRDQVLVEVRRQPRGYCWLEARYPGKGRLLICGFAIIKPWEATPAPRYLLSELFARLSADRQPTPLPQEQRND
ncbi:MAG: hypothetical protein K8T91_00515 [Planctomycetes bacterium]|nr:hypothetical protein [Planctomycetota bacterium]